MGRFSLAEIVGDGGICCPGCKALLHLDNGGQGRSLTCSGCGEKYGVIEEIPLLCRNKTDRSSKENIMEFWGSLHNTVYQDIESRLTSEEFSSLMEKLKDLFRHRQHLAAVEMPLAQLKNKKVLEIGSGTGAHTAFFSYSGAQVFSMDITPERVLATAKKLDLLNGNRNGFCLQADAESLPFQDNSFDIVYSNGVLHHTPDTMKTIAEIHRILKPGGEAVIMLYAKGSFYYWMVLFLLKGILMGNIFRSRNWLGRVTEWMSEKTQKVYNPETKVFSKKEIARLFAEFECLDIRKNSFSFQQIPLLGKKISNLAAYRTGFNEAGNILYGAPWRNETPFELWAGKYIGFALNIKARK